MERDIRKLREQIHKWTGGPSWFAQKLVDFVEHAPEHKDKLTALKLLLEYGFGKPVQAVQIDGAGEGGIQIVVNTGVIQPERMTSTPVTIIEEKPKALDLNEMPTAEGDVTAA